MVVKYQPKDKVTKVCTFCGRTLILHGIGRGSVLRSVGKNLLGR